VQCHSCLRSSISGNIIKCIICYKQFKCRVNKKNGQLIFAGKYCRLKDNSGPIKALDGQLTIDLMMRSIPSDLNILRYIDKTKSKEYNHDIKYIKSNIERIPIQKDNLEETYDMKNIHIRNQQLSISKGGNTI
jgi:hypothetical protein